MKAAIAAVLSIIVLVSVGGQSPSGGFSGLKTQLEQSLQSALGRTTPLKPLWKLPVPTPGSLVQTALSSDGRPLVAILNPSRTAIQVWSTAGSPTWGEPLSLQGRPIEHFSVCWGKDQSAWIALSNEFTARVVTWSGAAWVTVELPGPEWRGPLVWSSGLRLWGVRDLGTRRVLASARIDRRVWQTPGRTDGWELPGGAQWNVGEANGRLVLAVTGPSGGVYKADERLADQWVSLGFPRTVLALPEWGTLDQDLAVLLIQERTSALWTFSEHEAWRLIKEGDPLFALSNAGALLMSTRVIGDSLELVQYDGENWRVPLPLDQLVLPGSQGHQVQFLPPPGNAKTGVLVIDTSGWELP